MQAAKDEMQWRAASLRALSGFQDGLLLCGRQARQSKEVCATTVTIGIGTDRPQAIWEYG